MQDTTTSAMTEVALGLSMAFFTLLIVALLSMGFPIKTQSIVTKLPNDLPNSTVFDIQIERNDNREGKTDRQFAFYFKGKFYDQSLTLRTIDSFSKENHLIVAVNPNLTFAEVFTLKKQVSHPKLSITASNKTWQSRLQKMTTTH